MSSSLASSSASSLSFFRPFLGPFLVGLVLVVLGFLFKSFPASVYLFSLLYRFHADSASFFLLNILLRSFLAFSSRVLRCLFSS